MATSVKSALLGEQQHAFHNPDRSSSFTVRTDKSDCHRLDSDTAGPELRLDQGGGARSSLFDCVPFTPSQGVCGSGASAMSQTMFSPFSSFQGGVEQLGLSINSDGSSGSESTSAPTGGEGGLSSGYSPFMGAPWGNSLYAGGSDAPGPPTLELPNSPMSPGLVFNPSPGGTLPTPTSPRSLFSATAQGTGAFGSLSAGGLRSASGSMHLPPAAFSNNAAAAAAAADAAAAAAFNGLPPFYFNAAAAAAVAAAAAGGSNPAALQAALNQTLLNQHTAHLAAAAQQQQQHQMLQAALSATFANQAAAHQLGLPGAYPNPNLLAAALEPMRSAGGSLSLDGGLQQQASVNAAAALLQQQQQQQQLAAAAVAAQQHHQASHLRRNMSTPAGVAAQLSLSQAAAASALGLGPALTSAGSGLLGGHMGRLHVTHSADLSHLDTSALLGAGSGSLGAGRPKFNKSRKNSEPKIGPDGQPRLNARQRRTLRRAKERALKGLLEVSQALLQKAEVQVTVPNLSHFSVLEEMAAVEAEKEAADAEKEGNGGSGAGDGSCLSPSSGAGRGSGSSRGGQDGAGGPQKVTRSQQLSAAAAAVQESVCEIALAAVAAAAAQATGKDTSSAAAAAQAAAANANAAAASAGAVLPPDFRMPETEEGGCEELQGCNSDPLDCLTASSAPTSPVGSNLTADPSNGRSSSSSNSSLPGSARCSSSSTGSVTSAGAYGSAAAAAGKPPMCAPPRAASSAGGPGSSPLCSPLPSPTPSCGPASLATPKGTSTSQLEGIDIAGLIGQLSLKKDEGMVDDKLIRDLQIIQSLIGALKAPASASGLDSCGNSSSGGPPWASASPLPASRHMRPAGPVRPMPKQRCSSPICPTLPLHSL